MAKGYRAVDRDQQFLMPPDMRSWLPPGHAVFWIIDVVARLDSNALHVGRKTGGVGRAGYDPDMLLTLLIWAWAQGERSSRRIERLCHQDVAYRIICAGDVPDHVTISRFRRDLDNAVRDLFAQVLVLCAQLGMGRLGVVALDGVKIASNASTSANRTEDGLVAAAAAEAARRAARAEATREAVKAAAEHAAADSMEDTLFGSGTQPESVPEDRDDDQVGSPGAGQSRGARIDRALLAVREAKADMLEKARKQSPLTGPPTEYQMRKAEVRVEKARAEQQQVIDDWQARRDAYIAEHGVHRAGPHPTPVEERTPVVRVRTILEKLQARAAAATVAAVALTAGSAQPAAVGGVPAGDREPVRNITDPQSRLMPLRGGGWLQGYNCQAVTSSDGLNIATSDGTNPADNPTFIPMMAAAVCAAALIDANRGPTTTDTDTGIGILLADAGYLSYDNLAADGPDRLIATGKRRAVEAAARENPTTATAPDGVDAIEAMDQRLRTPAGIATYRQRSHIAETPFGHAKHNLRFRQFTGRGHVNAATEFTFHSLVHNLTKAFRHATMTA